MASQINKTSSKSNGLYSIIFFIANALSTHFIVISIDVLPQELIEKFGILFSSSAFITFLFLKSGSHTIFSLSGAFCQSAEKVI
jgi:hypothetical protein